MVKRLRRLVLPVSRYPTERFDSSRNKSTEITLALRDLEPQIMEYASAKFEKGYSIAHERPTNLIYSNRLVRNFFRNYVKYLGPLRDEPRPLYPLEHIADLEDVGIRGEHTAAVLDVNQSRKVDYVSPGFDVDLDGKVVVKSAPLKEAVTEWLSYLGVAESVSTQDHGKIGHSLQVATSSGQKAHDLTNLGVGVSQVLPIVVMALIAPTGSLLIFEQPELHLHPRVQARLGDFFLSLAFHPKQCIVETHSEYLVDRLRRRIAEAPGEKIEDLLAFHFVEQDELGQSTCERVEINEYGAIKNWPKDFFDQSSEEAEGILFAAARKRALEKERLESGRD